ncbi:hypothetical protein [Pedobacter duraquae]|uniref:Uncharacterized protein n=1 Tax=Pedobacter duraquae TaxID=425511 RepID=A0A4R6IES2_9SPHI|nr:hypothetical protein [Pedobacter duraquae]TDO20256.1 hypothetical protein CLV32_4016 [Pedobacter duraquae]
MESSEWSPIENELLSKYMIAYADIWADVLLNKNLNRHLRSIQEDLVHLNELIDGKEQLQQNALPIYRITNQLFRMQDVVRKKVDATLKGIQS